MNFTVEIILRSGGNESVIQIISLKLGNVTLIVAHDFSPWLDFIVIVDVSSNSTIVLFVADF